MPQSTILLFRKKNKVVPIKEWLDELEAKNPHVFAKCVSAILELERLGHEARRPHADFLRDDIRELRIKFKKMNFRMLYFFSGKDVIVLSHGCTKEDVVPPVEIDRAIEAKELVEADFETHTATWEEIDED